MTIGALICVIVAVVLTVHVVRWFRKGTLKPDPWDAETDAEVRSDSAITLCHRCFTPQEDITWFCPKCGSSVGPYNNWMPYLQIFALGEVLRTGTNDTYRKSPVTFFGYLLASFAEFTFFAPLYWFFFLRNYKKVPKPPEEAPAP